MRIVGAAAALLVLAHLLGLPINRALVRRERGSVHPSGRLVEVDGRRMHVVALGNGGPTVVLLAGANVPLPSADFGPLMRLLAPRFTVVCVEEPGVGHSDPTPVPRNEVMRLPFPGTIPVRKIVPRSTLKRVGEPYQREHLQRLGPSARLDVVEGSHFVHHTHAERILDATIELLERS